MFWLIPGLSQLLVCKQKLPLQAVAIGLLAFATLAYTPSEAWLTKCVNHALGISDDFDAQAVANTVWALALMGHLPTKLWVELLGPFQKACNDLKGEFIPLSGHAPNQYCFPASCRRPSLDFYSSETFDCVRK